MERCRIQFFVFAAQKVLTGTEKRKQLKKKPKVRVGDPLYMGSEVYIGIRRFNYRKVTRIAKSQEKKGPGGCATDVFRHKYASDHLNFQ